MPKIDSTITHMLLYEETKCEAGSSEDCYIPLVATTESLEDRLTTMEHKLDALTDKVDIAMEHWKSGYWLQ